jgi:hypothetical protein
VVAKTSFLKIGSIAAIVFCHIDIGKRKAGDFYIPDGRYVLKITLCGCSFNSDCPRRNM